MHRIRFVIPALLALAAAAAAAAGAEVSSAQENSLLAQVLKLGFGAGGYTVVDPMTRLSHMDTRDQKEIAASKKYILKELGEHGQALPALVERLFERNRNPVRLSLKSSPEDGYIIDDGEYARYFKPDGGGWEKWHQEHPMAHGHTTVSLPVYDEKSGLLLVYVGTQYDWLAGAGYVLLFRLDKDGLHQLAEVMLWIS